MKTTRKKVIHNKVFSKNTVGILWNRIKNEFDGSKKPEDHSWMKLEIYCDDGTSYESDTNDLLQDGDVIDTKKCTSISIEFCNSSQERRISLNLTHGDTYSNYLIVRGDKNWVLGTFDSLNDIIEAERPQRSWFVKYQHLIVHLGAPIFAFSVSRFLGLIWHVPVKPIENPSETILALRDFLQENKLVLYFVQVLFFWLQGILPLYLLQDWALKLWPSIEFDFGPEHKKTEKIKRVRLGLFFSFIIIPILVNVIYEVFSKTVSS